MTYPTIMPAITLDFANSQQLDPRVTFSRSSSATYINSAGQVASAAEHEPRFDHDGNGECLGLLMEESRTNVVQSSDDYNASGWTRVGLSATANSGTAPDGTNNASLVQSTVNGPASLKYYVATTGATTLSAFVKAGTSHTIHLYLHDDQVRFDLSTETITAASSATILATSIRDVGNGWYRCSMTSTRTGQTEKRVIVNNSDGSYLASIGDNVLIWGWQIEEGEFPTSLIPTAGSTATRSQDLAQVTTADIYGDEFTIINKPFGVSSGGPTLHLQGYPHVERAAVYNENLSQEQINTVAGVDEFWQWRILGSSFALPNFVTDGQVTVDWGDGTVETLTTNEHTFTNGDGYHDVGFRLDSGTYFRPRINNNASHDTKVVALGPAPESMKLDGQQGFYGCTNLEAFDATVDTSSASDFHSFVRDCTSLTSFPQIDTSSGISFYRTWRVCSSLTSFPLINTSSGTTFYEAWRVCSSLTSFPALDTSSGANFQRAWYDCSSLTSFPLLDVSSGTNFLGTWRNCSSLTSFPLINTSSGTTFYDAWYNCNSLTTFPANMFDTTGTLAATAFNNAWYNCALTAQSIENILVSLDTNGATGIRLGIQGGTNAAKTTWSTTAVTAYDNLIVKGWTITFNA